MDMETIELSTRKLVRNLLKKFYDTSSDNKLGNKKRCHVENTRNNTYSGGSKVVPLPPDQ